MRIALWLRYLIFSPTYAPPTASVWAIFFDSNRPSKNTALKEEVSVNEFVYHRRIFDLNIGGAVLRNDYASGSVTKDGLSLAWDLDWQPSLNSFRGYPNILYHLPWPSTKVVAPNLKVEAIGWIDINGKQYRFNKAPLHQGHIWGKIFTKNWAWANCGAFSEDKSAVLEMLSTPRFGLGYLKSSSDEMRFKVRGAYSLDGWEFTGRKLFTKVSGVIKTAPQNIIGVTYNDPAGGHRYCYNTKVADSEIRVHKKGKGGWKTVQTFSSNKTCAYESVSSVPSTKISLCL